MGAAGPPKRKTSKGRRNKRRANHKLVLTKTVKCKSCGADKMAHQKCPSCGKYNSRHENIKGS